MEGAILIMDKYYYKDKVLEFLTDQTYYKEKPIHQEKKIGNKIKKKLINEHQDSFTRKRKIIYAIL